MTDTSALVELAAKCEAATGPNGELDRLIWIVTDPHGYSIWEGKHRGLLNKAWDEDRRQVTIKANARIAAKRVTASLDAALTLVPEGGAAHCGFFLGMKAQTVTAFTDDDNCEGFRASARTPALALCAAALRARSTQGTNLQDTPASHGEPRG